MFAELAEWMGHPMRWTFMTTMTLALTGAAAAAEIIVDCAVPQGTIRPLHGVNGAPMNQGETVNLTKYWREAGIPLARLHDCEWPGGRVVDFKAIFPVLSADPNDPKNYHFGETDEYVKAVLDSGAKIVYRLGENIEHTRVKHRVHPPADVDNWAKACVGIVKHYNDGWAGGFRHKINYWEIWNEPENRPAMWTGSDEQYLRLYATTAKAVKAAFPDVKVGGPALGSIGKIVDGKLQPIPLLSKFIAEVKDKSLPLDFFSFHGYSDDPSIFAKKAEAVRRYLDDHSISGAEIHLNEWNYLPNNDWGPVSPGGEGVKRRLAYEEMGGARGAAFVATVLMNLQDSPVDAANMFSGDSGPFGLFTQHGEPKKTYYAVKAFRQLVECPDRMAARGIRNTHGGVLAGMTADKRKVVVLLANYREQDDGFELTMRNLPWKGPSRFTVRRLDAKENLERAEVEVADSTIAVGLEAPGVALITVEPK
jgi:xylan 1,4-beta-xylosidase